MPKKAEAAQVVQLWRRMRARYVAAKRGVVREKLCKFTGRYLIPERKTHMFGTGTGPIRWRTLLPMLLVVLGGALLSAGVALAGSANSPSAGSLIQQAKPSSVNGQTGPITDNGVTSFTLNVTTPTQISAVEVTGISIAHQYPADLDVYLISPDNTKVALFYHICGVDPQTGVIAPWTAGTTGFNLSDGAVMRIGDTCPPGAATYSPRESLSAFNGKSAVGTWTLEIHDNASANSAFPTPGAPDTGSLLGWGLAFNANVATAEPTITIVPATLVPTRTPVLADENFSDVSSSDYFYQGVRFLVAKGAISGYNDAAHCGTSAACFLPYSNVTRGQLTKIVVLGLDITRVGAFDGNHFTDVPDSNPFALYINTAHSFGIISGYNDVANCGNASPCFKPFNDITRGQLTKVVVLGSGWNLLPASAPQSFTDVPASNPFYSFIQTAACYGVITGYNDHTFRYQNTATRGQVSKMVYLSYTKTSADACSAAPTAVSR